MYRHHPHPISPRTTTVNDRSSASFGAGDDDGLYVLMEWSLWDERDDDMTGRRIRVVPHDGPRGTWKAILEMQPHAEFWVEKATIGYGDSLDEFAIADL